MWCEDRNGRDDAEFAGESPKTSKRKQGAPTEDRSFLNCGQLRRNAKGIVNSEFLYQGDRNGRRDTELVYGNPITPGDDRSFPDFH